MTTQETFQIPIEVARTYEAKFVPNIFAEWAPPVVDAAEVTQGQQVLDVACGTGIVARTAVEQVGDNGSVVGYDLNEAMLTVAREIQPDIDWRLGDAGDMPFADDSFDVATCQMAFMFFPEPQRVVAEMARVVKPGGRIAIAVPADLDSQPAYRPFVDIAIKHGGKEAESLLNVYWSCGDLGRFSELIESAGVTILTSRTRSGIARFDSSDEFVATEVEGSPLIDRLDDKSYAAIRRDTAQALAGYNTDSGRFEVPLVGHIVVAVV